MLLRGRCLVSDQKQRPATHELALRWAITHCRKKINEATFLKHPKDRQVQQAAFRTRVMMLERLMVTAKQLDEMYDLPQPIHDWRCIVAAAPNPIPDEDTCVCGIAAGRASLVSENRTPSLADPPDPPDPDDD